ncbi:MAG TPA: nucleoside transporter C-terminal domain-containing protein [Longimicrobiales bacterium]
MKRSRSRRRYGIPVSVFVLLFAAGAAWAGSTKAVPARAAGVEARGAAAVDAAAAPAAARAVHAQATGATDSAVAGPAAGAAAESGAAPAQAPAADATARQPAQQDAGAAVQRAREAVDTPLHARLVSLLGLVAMVGIAWLLSTDRRMIPWRVVVWGTGLQFVFALLILRTAVGAAAFDAINDVLVALLGFTVDGARFLFGNLVSNTVPVVSADGAAATGPALVANTGAFFAFNVLPTIIFFSSLMTVLYYLGVMQAVVKGVAWVMMRTLRTSGAETLSTAGNIFVGQTEAPLLIKPFVATMTMSELMAVMTAGFATVAGGVMAAYVGMLVAYFPDIAGHLVAASVLSAPAALVIAKVMHPETEEPVTRGTLKVDIENPDANVIDAAARGAGEGLTLALNVGAMLLAFIALIAMLNAVLSVIGDATHVTDLLRGWGWLGEGQRLTLEAILGWLLAPLAWIMGVPWEDAAAVGSLLGVKTVLNEFVAYLQLSTLLSGGGDLSPRSVVIATYALCGFANFSSIAIQIGGIGGIAPSRRSDLSRLGLRAMIGGTLASFMTATVAGILV